MADSIGAAWAHVGRLALAAKDGKAQRDLRLSITGDRVFEIHLRLFRNDDDREVLRTMADRMCCAAQAVIRTKAEGFLGSAADRAMWDVSWGVFDVCDVGGCLAYLRRHRINGDGAAAIHGPWAMTTWRVENLRPLVEACAAIDLACAPISLEPDPR